MDPKYKVDINAEVEGAIHSLEFLVADKDTELVYHTWVPTSKEPSPALIVLMHGLGDHVAHMMTVVNYMIKSMNMTVCGYDQRGHGESPGPRGHIAKWDIFRSDLTLFCDILTQKYPNLPIILFGNSMGGLCVLDYAMHEPNEKVKGVIANAPALNMQDLNAAAGTFVWACSKIAPGLAVGASLNSAKLTKDAGKQKENDSDVLVHTKASMRLLEEIKRVGRWVRNNPDKMKLPFLLLQGNSDPIVTASVNIDFEIEVRKHNQNSFKFEVKDGMHELFNDIGRDLVFEQCKDFLEVVLAL